MRILGWIFTLTFWLTVASFLHYTLPQRDIVYVQGTEIIRQDFSGWNRMFYASADSGNAEGTINRDLRLINAKRANGRVMVYRNEDTGFWPPYFKFDSSNLQAEAQGAVSTKQAPAWYLLTHYGWRNELLTIYPNAVGLREWPGGPDAGKPLPWVNIILLTLFAGIYYTIWVRWRRFRQKRLDPAFEEIQDNLEATGDALAARRSRFRRWLNTWRS